eukprot:12438472-Alexandrium_andersonii.AAC.1
MSASLVGSEMCIRDRTSGCASSRAGNPPRSAASAASGARRIPEWGKAVSYTHLTLPTICSV